MANGIHNISQRQVASVGDTDRVQGHEPGKFKRWMVKLGSPFKKAWAWMKGITKRHRSIHTREVKSTSAQQRINRGISLEGSKDLIKNICTHDRLGQMNTQQLQTKIYDAVARQMRQGQSLSGYDVMKIADSYIKEFLQLKDDLLQEASNLAQNEVQKQVLVDLINRSEELKSVEMLRHVWQMSRKAESLIDSIVRDGSLDSFVESLKDFYETAHQHVQAMTEALTRAGKEIGGDEIVAMYRMAIEVALDTAELSRQDMEKIYQFSRSDDLRLMKNALRLIEEKRLVLGESRVENRDILNRANKMQIATGVLFEKTAGMLNKPLGELIPSVLRGAQDIPGSVESLLRKAGIPFTDKHRMDAVVSSKSLMKEVRPYFEKRFSTELLDFYHDVFKYNNLPEDKKESMAEQIYNKYINKGAVSEINISDKMVRNIQEGLKNKSYNGLFNEAQQEVISLIVRNNILKDFFRANESRVKTEVNRQIELEKMAGGIVEDFGMQPETIEHFQRVIPSVADRLLKPMSNGELSIDAVVDVIKDNFPILLQLTREGKASENTYANLLDRIISEAGKYAGYQAEDLQSLYNKLITQDRILDTIQAFNGFSWELDNDDMQRTAKTIYTTCTLVLSGLANAAGVEADPRVQGSGRDLQEIAPEIRDSVLQAIKDNNDWFVRNVYNQR